MSDDQKLDDLAELARQAFRREIYADFASLPQAIEKPLNMPWQKLSEADKRGWRAAVQAVIDKIDGEPTVMLISPAAEG